MVEPFDIGFFEEPMPPEDRDGYCKVQAENLIPVAGKSVNVDRSPGKIRRLLRRIASVPVVWTARPEGCSRAVRPSATSSCSAIALNWLGSPAGLPSRSQIARARSRICCCHASSMVGSFRLEIA